PCELKLNARIVDGNVRWKDEGVAVPLFPEAVDNSSHQTQHTSSALELHQGGPVGIEPVEDLLVDRICRLQTMLIVGVATLRRKLLVLRPIQVVEGPSHGVPPHKLRFFDNRLE